MRKGFIFNTDKCVGCNACSAACILENDWTVHSREIYTFNSEVVSSFPLVYISLACNHCERPACLEGCPSGSYFRDKETGAVVIDDRKCLGCRYCKWNCPYDAPKLDKRKGIIGKCNLCYSGLKNGRLPACASACPTGALYYGELSDQFRKSVFSWFPDKNLDPSLELKGNRNIMPPRVIPERKCETDIPQVKENEETLFGEWSLIAFSFLATLSVSSFVSSVINGVFPNIYLFVLVILLAGICSLFHLGKVSRAWRAVSNLRTSPLSREIFAFIIYSVVSVISLFLEIPVLLIVSSIISFVLLFLIDSVYLYSDKRLPAVVHSGQTFLSSLIFISFFTGSIIPFIFIALIKVISSLYFLSIKKVDDLNFGIRFLRLLFLLFSGACIISGHFKDDPVIMILFITGELFDRILFYIDFKPLNIKTLIYEQINTFRDEKKNG
jgi:Fe-S-cluster-containing dehydrogenase component/DMSO reductase anchor subunit